MITQHMPPGFTRNYAARLDGLCKIRVKEASDGERILPGHAYIAPGGLHLSVERSGANYIARVRDGEPVNRHKPSVEVLFKSAARVVGPNALGIMLTGMGADGAKAMREMRDAGSFNLRARMRPVAWCSACRARPSPPGRPTRCCRSRASRRRWSRPPQHRRAAHLARLTATAAAFAPRSGGLLLR
jgi:hypothetical protein